MKKRKHNAARIGRAIMAADPFLKQSDMRVGQFIINAVSTFTASQDPYFMEDEELAGALESYLARLHTTKE